MNEIDEAGLNPASDLDQLDPLLELERLIVDCTCDWCGKTYPAGWDEEHRVWVPSVIQEWRVRVEKKPGYISKMYAFWRVCAPCRLGDEYSFSKFVFPLIRNLTAHDLVEQLVQVQPMQVPAGGLLYMDYVHGPRERNVEGCFEQVRRQAHADMKDAFIGALLVAQAAPLRGRKAHGIMLDDANWRLDVDAVRMNGNEITVDATLIPQPTPEHIEVNFTVNKDGAISNDPGEPDI